MVLTLEVIPIMKLIRGPISSQHSSDDLGIARTASRQVMWDGGGDQDMCHMCHAGPIIESYIIFTDSLQL